MSKTDNIELWYLTALAAENMGLKTIYGQVHERKGNIYEPIDAMRLRRVIIDQFGTEKRHDLISMYGVENIIYLLKGFTYVPDDQVNTENYFCAQNGVLKINDEGKIELFQDNDLIFTNSGQTPYLPDCDMTPVEDFLSLVIPAEKERRHFLESCAVGAFPYLRHVVNFDHFNICFGTGANGKSVLFESILTPIFGEKAIANVTVEELKQRFYLHNLLGCKLNISTENDEAYLREHKQLKALTSGDRQLIERKHEQPFFARIFIVPFFCINQEPQIGNVSHAMKRRLMVINFPNRFSDNAEDPTFKANPELKNPLSEKCRVIQQGMFKLILNTVERLLAEKSLTPVDLSRIEELQKESSHIRLFIDDYFVFDKGCSITAYKLFEKYKEYCSLKGYYNSKWERWNDPSSKYDPAMKHTAALTGKLVRLFQDQLSHCKENGDRALKGLREKSNFEKTNSIGTPRITIYMDEKFKSLGIRTPRTTANNN